MLANHHILVVEGFLLSGPDLRDALIRAGATVHVVSTVASALMLVQQKKVTAAIIDTATRAPTQSLCRALDERQIPFIFCSGPTRLQSLQSRREAGDEAAAMLGESMSFETAA